MKVITPQITDQLDLLPLGQLFITDRAGYTILNMPVRKYTLDAALQLLTKKNTSKNLLRKYDDDYCHVLNKV